MKRASILLLSLLAIAGCNKGDSYDTPDAVKPSTQFETSQSKGETTQQKGPDTSQSDQ